MAVYVESREESDAVPEEEQEAVVPPLTQGEILKLLALDPKQHFTQPPPRYTEASLVKTLEERGIGRPSTYAQILSTIQDREYVRREKGTLFPTELGMLVTDRLVPFFPEIMDIDFTAQLEESLDKVEEGDADWVELVGQVQQAVRQGHPQGEVGHAGQQGRREDTGEKCPDCGKPVLEKWGRFGKFLACSGYPDCKYTKDLGGREKPADEMTDEACPTCAQAHGDQARPLREVHRLLGLPRVQDDQARHPRDRLLRGRLRRPARRAPEQAGQDLLRLQQVPRLQVRRLGAPDRRAMPEVRRGVPDGADRQGRQADPRLHPRRVRLQGRGRPFGGVSLRP